MSRKNFFVSFIPVSILVGFILYQAVDQQHIVQEIQEEAPDIHIASNIDIEKTVVTHNADKQEETSVPHTRDVKFHNKITKKMLTYHKGFFSLTPTFNLTVQDEPLKSDQVVSLPIKDNKVTVTYDYNFMGHKKGKKSIDFEIPAQQQEFDITFSWQHEPRIIIDKAKALTVKEIY